MMMIESKYWIILLILIQKGLGALDTNNVPAILFSHRLSSGIAYYQQGYNYEKVVPNDSFKLIAQELISYCNSDAYIFINQPGLTEYDLVQYRENFFYLEQYLERSSSPLKFEKCNSIDDFTFNDLIKFTQDKCHVEKKLRFTGIDEDQYEPYIDSEPRIIRIDLPELPIVEHFNHVNGNGNTEDISIIDYEDQRSEAITLNDNFIRYIIAQIPSPHITVIYTSLNSEDIDEVNIPVGYDGIFNDVFEIKKDVEKNNMIKEQPVFKNKPVPLFEGMSNKYISIFDNSFLNENEQLIDLIISVTFGFVVYQVFSFFTSRKSKLSKEGKTIQKNDKKLKQKVVEDVKNDSKIKLDSERKNDSNIKE